MSSDTLCHDRSYLLRGAGNVGNLGGGGNLKMKLSGINETAVFSFSPSITASVSLHSEKEPISFQSSEIKKKRF